MTDLLPLAKYSIGVGDRFGQQARAQLQACMLAAQSGVRVIPVWNKSEREHRIIGSEPAGTRLAAEAAVTTAGWREAYHVDADHIGLETVDRFVPYADFYTIDVADWIGRPADPQAVKAFVHQHPELAEPLHVPGLEHPLVSSKAALEGIAGKYLSAVQAAGKIYRHIVRQKGNARFITEVSMDETDTPQVPIELVTILAALADEAVPVQTIAPKFSGRFNKGVDYVGDLAQFELEFSADLSAVTFACTHYDLPRSLKLSIHSGSDKFSLYPVMHQAVVRFDTGLHLKTAGTTWLEEVLGLAEAGGEGLNLAKEIYRQALDEIDALCAPYANVIDIHRERLPRWAAVRSWSMEEFVRALRHDPAHPGYNPDLRQLLHVGYKVAARMGARYLEALKAHERIIGLNVTKNLFDRHIKPLFL